MWTDDDIKDFYQNYRESLSKQYESSLQNLDQQRKNVQASIMSGANKAGMMYSNFPERSKLQYDMNTYLPSQVKARNTYQTGLDSLRNNVLKYQNSITDLQEATAALDSTYGGGGGGTSGTGGTSTTDTPGTTQNPGTTSTTDTTNTTDTSNTTASTGANSGDSNNTQSQKVSFYPITPATWPKQYVSERPFIVGGGYTYTIPGQGDIDVESGRTLVIKDGDYYTVKQYGRYAWGDPKQVWPH